MPGPPRLDQYQQAVLSPSTAFADPELRAGLPTPGLFGLPEVYSGPFAAVFPLQAGSKKWAVRCFLTPSSHQEDRFAKIARAVKGANLSFLVPFEFQPRGIRVEGEWHPLIKMPWIEGDSLSAYVERHRADRTRLGDLVKALVTAIRKLEERGMAHGDLHHGNVLVREGELTLVDYDGLFVAGLRGDPPAEVGHPNYQHPRRDASLYSETMDRFSLWAICLPLLALRVDSDLWTKHGGGDERLLFARADFDDPASSRLIQDLLALPDRMVRHLTRAFLRVLGEPAVQCPPLDQFLIKKPTVSSQPTDPRSVYVSYAWGEDQTSVGRQREEVVDRLEGLLKEDGHQVIRDKSVLRVGDSIGRFMKAIGRGHRIVVVLSDKYLRSAYCMNELYHIYQRCLGDKEEFCRRIVTVVLEDARIDTWQDRLSWYEHWKAVHDDMVAHRDKLGRADDEQRRLIQHWLLEVSDMLAYLADSVSPRGFDALVADEFASVREALRRPEE